MQKISNKPSGASVLASNPKAAERDLRSSVQSLAKGFRVLESFSHGAEEMTLSEVAEVADLDPGTTFRMLNTLVSLGYIERIPGTKRFTLTLKVLDLGFHAIGRKDLRSMVRPALRSLVDEVSEAASFGVLEGGDVLYIERVRAGFTRLGVDIRIGTKIPVSISAIGQAILAFLPDDRLKAALEAKPAQEWSNVPPVPRVRLLRKLERIRAEGYIIEDSGVTAGLCVLSMPVLGPDGHAIGAISLAAPSVLTSVNDLKKRGLGPLRAAVRDTARALEATGSTTSA